MIIGLSGNMGVGKSTAVDLLKDKYGDDKVVILKFAAPLYDMQEFIYRRISSVHKRPPNFIKDRKLLQWLGTEFGRDSISKSLWVDLWAVSAKDLLSQGKIVVSDDTRFDNEAEIIKSLGGNVVKITSDKSHDRIDTKSGISNHQSEAGISDKFIDFHIENNQSLEDYKVKLCSLYLSLVKQSNKL